MIQYNWMLAKEWFPVLFPIWLFIIGSAFGSFLNVVVYRLPIIFAERRQGIRKTTLSTPPSTCPKCGHGIRAWENIPVFGWFILRGKCSSCSLPISPRYPTVEFFAGASFVIPFFFFSMVEDWAVATILCFIIVASVSWLTANGKKI